LPVLDVSSKYQDSTEFLKAGVPNRFVIPEEKKEGFVMPQLKPILSPSVSIDPIPTGAGGIVRGATITVKGKAHCTDENDPTKDLSASITDVAVQLGVSKPFVKANPTGPVNPGTSRKLFTTWATDARSIFPSSVVNNALQITARVSAGPDAQATATVTVTVDRTPPILNLSTQENIEQTVTNGKATFQLAGTASDPDNLSPVVAVEWVLKDRGTQYTLATPKAPGDWSKWTASVQVSSAGTYVASVQARDGEGNISTPVAVTLNALEPFQPKDPNDVFSPVTYLDDLLKFAGVRMIDAQGGSLTPARFTTAYRQRFADLADPNAHDVATAPVRQLRVCVEVLRAFLAGAGKSTPPAEEAKYRQQAYAALLRNLGTSFDEIRRARGDEAARANLAARLGVDRPDRLDQLLLLPGEITEAKLEQLFGLQDTTRDPLLRSPQPQLLIWQLNRLGSLWQEQDDAARIYGDIPVPIIDPDLLAETDFHTPNAVADPAFALWSARKAEIASLLKQIDDLRKSKSDPIAGFDAVVNQFVAKVEDLAALLADYQIGKDIVSRLNEKHLSADAFLHLMRTRDLVTGGTVLDADWDDVYAISAQVAKLARYPVWRDEEEAKGLTLDPDYFVLPDPTTPPAELPEWRASSQARRAWQATLQTRISQQQSVMQALLAVVDAAEADALPQLRDFLIATAGDAARGLFIDLTGSAIQRTTRSAQAIETLQGALFAVRVGTFTAGHPAAGWKLAQDYSEADFDEDWVFWGSYETWQGAMRVFIYPESHLLPTLRPASADNRKPTDAYQTLIKNLRTIGRIVPAQARDNAAAYLTDLRNELNLPPELRDPPPPTQNPFLLTEQLTDSQLAARQALSAKLMATFENPYEAPSYLNEIFYFVPLLCALQLQQSGEYLAALDWFRTVYAYHLPPGRLTADMLPKDTLPPGKPLPDRRQIYYGLTLEEQIPTQFVRPKDWPREGLNPHDIVQDRARALAGFTVISLVTCFAAFADAEFTRDTDESIARARSLYQTGLDLLALEYPADDSTSAPASPYGLNPVVEALRLRVASNLRKLRLGRNIAGLERQASAELVGTAIAPPQPTPYRYAVLLARAKELTQNAAQMEAALLAALEKRDAESYNLFKAMQDVETASETVRLQDLRVKEAKDGITLAELQQDRAQIQLGHFEELIDNGTSDLEIASMALAFIGSGASGAGAASGGGDAAAGGSTGLGSLFGGLGSLIGQFASNERREEEWILQRNLAQQDVVIGGQQALIAKDNLAAATQEQRIAQIQMGHAAATVQFLATKFTNAELYEFMSAVLDGVYRFFLQQATALAKLAENQLAFERQEPPQGIIQGDYYAAPDGGPDRQGITGSARLLADIVQLDQHAFLTDQRKLQLTKTFSLARLAPVEFARFRDTGVLIFGTALALFDRDFPGHYLRVVKRVRTSVIALVPPTEGIRATLSTPGSSRVVIGGEIFRNVVIRRDPETVSLTSPRDATGLFELVPDSQPELLLPFEGTGVDTVWRFELPKAANPFDYSTIADVLVTLEYTALNSFDYREQVIQALDPEVSNDQPFSFRQQFPDEWYDLHNPDQAATPMVVRFKTTLGDFVPNIDELKIQHLMFYVAPANGKSVELQGVRLLFNNDGDQNPVGGSADTVDGVISTRRTNGSSWLQVTGNRPPIGEWELTLPTDDTTKNFFRNDEIEDILFVITYSGRTPEWPG
jgi:hypothetical protein